MQVGSLPLWVMIFIGSVVISLILGLLNPYVTRATLIRLENVDKEDWSKPRPIVTINERMSPAIVIDIIFVVLLVGFICFVVQGLDPIVNSIGGGVLITIVIVLISIIASSFIFIIDMIAYITGVEIAAKKIKRHFERQYGAKIERQS